MARNNEEMNSVIREFITDLYGEPGKRIPERLPIVENDKDRNHTDDYFEAVDGVAVEAINRYIDSAAAIARFITSLNFSTPRSIDPALSIVDTIYGIFRNSDFDDITITARAEDNIVTLLVTNDEPDDINQLVIDVNKETITYYPDENRRIDIPTTNIDMDFVDFALCVATYVMDNVSNDDILDVPMDRIYQMFTKAISMVEGVTYTMRHGVLDIMYGKDCMSISMRTAKIIYSVRFNGVVTTCSDSYTSDIEAFNSMMDHFVDFINEIGELK